MFCLDKMCIYVYVVAFVFSIFFTFFAGLHFSVYENEQSRSPGTRDQILLKNRLLNHTGGWEYIYCLKVVIQLPPMLIIIIIIIIIVFVYSMLCPLVQFSRIWH